MILYIVCQGYEAWPIAIFDSDSAAKRWCVHKGFAHYDEISLSIWDKSKRPSRQQLEIWEFGAQGWRLQWSEERERAKKLRRARSSLKTRRQRRKENVCSVCGERSVCEVQDLKEIWTEGRLLLTTSWAFTEPHGKPVKFCEAHKRLPRTLMPDGTLVEPEVVA